MKTTEKLSKKTNNVEIKEIIQKILERSFVAHIQYSEDLPSLGKSCSNHGFAEDYTLISPLEKFLTMVTTTISSEREEVGNRVLLSFSAEIIVIILDKLVKINLDRTDYGSNVGIDFNFKVIGRIDAHENPKIAIQQRVLAWVREASSDEAECKRVERKNLKTNSNMFTNIFGRKIHRRRRGRLTRTSFC